MSKFNECMCRVCEQKRLAAAEVDKLKSMMVKPLSADHEMQYGGNLKAQMDAADAKKKKEIELHEQFFEDLLKTQEDVEQMKVAAADKRIADLQAKILKQDKQFAELAQENENHKQALVVVINTTGAKIKELEEENEKIKYTISENCDLRKEIERVKDELKATEEVNAAKLDISEKAMLAVKNTACETIKGLNTEAEYWRLRALKNKPVGSVNPALLVSPPSGAKIGVIGKSTVNAADLAKEISEQIKKSFHSGGCV